MSILSKYVCILVVLFVAIHLEVFGQVNSTHLQSSNTKNTGPTIAIGMGTLTYFGELNTTKKISSPLTSRLAYTLSFRQDINHFLQFEIGAWTGVVSANERTNSRNLNFESTLHGVSMNINYNFGNFLKTNHTVEPIIGVGIEVINFNSKTDLLDQNGIRYNYWRDGTIRNLPENHPEADRAVEIQRDFYYETDIKTSPMYGLDEYNTYSIGFPVTVGANMNLTNNLKLRFAFIYHFAGTDLIDGMAKDNGNFGAGPNNDNLLFSSASLGYTFPAAKKSRKQKSTTQPSIEPLIYDEDIDNDKVPDSQDDCIPTPEGAEVDERGCPVDKDFDGVPDYKDKELLSAPNAQVDSLGVTITDQVRDEYYIRFYDQTGNYSPIEASTNTVQVIANKVMRKGKIVNKTYAVEIGEFSGNIPSDLINSVLELRDVSTYETDSNVVVAVGRYTKLSAAVSRQQEIEKQGIHTLAIIVIDPNLHISKLNKSDIEQADVLSTYTHSNTIYRIQVGAFSKTPDETKLSQLPDIIKISSNDGLTRYYAGAYNSYQKAVEAKETLFAQLGFENAFIVAFENGTIKQLHSNGSVTKKSSDGKDVKFRVQIGSYKHQIPTDRLEQFMQLDDVRQFVGTDGFIRYTAGEFATYDQANAYKKEIRKQGFGDSYVVGEYNGELISAAKALELLK